MNLQKETRSVESAGKIKVLIVDYSAIVRKIFSNEHSKHEDIEVIGTAPDLYVALRETKWSS